MASIFQRVFKVAQSEAHSGMDKFEDPIKMSEQGIRDLKKNLQASMVSLAQVKSLAIRLQKETDDHKKRGADYERKAMLLLKRMQGGGNRGHRSRTAGHAGSVEKRRSPTERRDGLGAAAGAAANGRPAPDQGRRTQAADRQVRERGHHSSRPGTHRLVDAQDQPAIGRRRRLGHRRDA